MARNPAYNDKTCQLVARRYKASKKYCEPYFDRFLDNYKHYFLRIIDEAIEGNEEIYPFYSTMMLPISYETVETILPRMFSRLPSFSITTDEQNDEKNELALKELVRYQLQHPYLVDDPIYLRIVTMLKELFITGNAWGEVPWEMKEAEVQEHQPYSIQLGIMEASWDNLEICERYGVEPDWKLVKVRRRLIDAPVLNHRSIFHTFPDPKKKRVGDLGWIIFEDFLTKDDIMDLVAVNPKKYKNIPELKKMTKWKEDDSNSDSRAYDQEIESIFGASDVNTKDPEEPLYKVWFMREKYKYVIVVNEKLTIRDTDNPNGDGKLGVFLCKDIPVPNQLFAWGEIDPIKKIEDSMTDQANMRNDSVFYDLLKMWKLDPTALVDGEEFFPEPGTIVQMSDMTGLAAIEGATTPASAYREYDEWDTIIQKATGVTDYSTGQSDPGMNPTKGGVELLQQAANARFMMKLRLFEEIGLKAIGTMYVQRNLMFFDEPQAINTGKGKMIVTPDQIRRIRGGIHFIVETGSTESVNQDKELRKWDLILSKIEKGATPFDNLSQEAKDYVARRFLNAMGESEVEQILQRVQAVAPNLTPDGPGGAGIIPGDAGAEEVARAMAEAGIDGGSTPSTPVNNAQPINTQNNAQPVSQPISSDAPGA